MSTAVMSTSMFDCNELLFKNSAKSKDSVMNPAGGSLNHGANGNGNGHPPLRRTYTSLVTTLMEQHRKLDRSLSEPTSRYKTELCRPFEENGSCKYGDKCQFAHGYNELRNLARHPKYKTELCRTFHTIGFCPYGPRCHFIHNFEEARIHNQKVSAQLGVTQAPKMALRCLNNLNPINVSLLDQIASSPQMAAVTAALAQQPLIRTNSLGLNNNAGINNATAVAYNNQTLLRTTSLGLPSSENHQQNHLHTAHNQQMSISVIGGTRPKPLNLSSPTFSLGSTGADSISPSSSLSQSPTNSMTSFFSDDSVVNQQNVTLPTTPFSFGQDFGLLPTRQSDSPSNSNGVCSPVGSDELSPRRTPSPLSPNSDRLPVFNKLSSIIGDFDNLKV